MPDLLIEIRSVLGLSLAVSGISLNVVRRIARTVRGRDALPQHARRSKQ